LSPRKEFAIPQNLEFFNGRIAQNPDLCNGHPTIRSKRITVQSILAGDSESDILGEFPELESADIWACLMFASQLMNQRYDYANLA